ncbi:AAA family ATPase [Actinomadura chokoriensis]|uniref:AAA family ATPase n=1 Tax=Actinomadura chokoriensis TaxID=454156 RepID=A0ABV4R955_9ACTN
MTSENDTSNASDTEQSREELDAELLGDVRDGVWLDSQEFPPLQWAVPGLLPEGMTILVGPPKAGKSWLIGNILLGLAAGGHAVGKLAVGKARRVLYLALEDGDRRMQSRCRIILDGGPIPGLFHYMTTLPPGKVIPVMEAWLRLHPDTAMIVLDTLGRVMPPALQGESQYQRDYRVGAQLKTVADTHPGLAVVVVHHDRKAAAEDFVDAVSGTNGLAGSADAVIVLARKRKAEDAFLKVTGKDVPEAEYALRLVDGTNWVLDGEDLDQAAERAEKRQDEAAVSDLSAQIIDFVRKSPGRQAKAKDVADKFGANAHTYLKRHTEAGRLVKLQRGLYRVPDGRAVSEPSEPSESQVTGSQSSNSVRNDDEEDGETW